MLTSPICSRQPCPYVSLFSYTPFITYPFFVAEFSSQLPHGGGAFYSAPTAEASRAHYARAWPSLLYAAALRYNAHIKDGYYNSNIYFS